jgi:hypothetical protein
MQLRKGPHEGKTALLFFDGKKSAADAKASFYLHLHSLHITYVPSNDFLILKVGPKGMSFTRTL